jgi:AraC-like DNA-binding protein
LKCVASKLGRYCRDDVENPYEFIPEFANTEDAVKALIKNYPKGKYVSAIFDFYAVNCTNMHQIDCDRLDGLIDRLESGDGYTDEILAEIIELVKPAREVKDDSVPVIDRIKRIIEDNIENDISVAEVAQKVGMSKYYMSHIFRKITEITVIEYKNELKITKAKRFLVSTDESITDIAFEVGFASSSHFISKFKKQEGITPKQFRVKIK